MNGNMKLNNFYLKKINDNVVIRAKNSKFGNIQSFIVDNKSNELMNDQLKIFIKKPIVKVDKSVDVMNDHLKIFIKPKSVMSKFNEQFASKRFENLSIKQNIISSNTHNRMKGFDHIIKTTFDSNIKLLYPTKSLEITNIDY